MDIYSAIMKAADHISAEPFDYNYGRTRHYCGTPCCVVGWIGVFSGETEEQMWECLEPRTTRLIGVGYRVFDERMNNLAPGWKTSAELAAHGARLYAAKYHAPVTPDWNAIASRPTITDSVKSQEVA